MKLLGNKSNERGVSTILVVGVLLVFILFFFVVGIDFAYVYTVRGQMQNAADAAALAGAAVLNDNPYDTVQTLSRDEAKKFSAENTAANEPVVLEDADISVGFWDGSSFSPNTTPVNAVKVETKRLKSRNNAVELYFGGIVGWGEMDIVRVAIASKPARAEVPIALCRKSCDPGIINAAGVKFYWAPPYEPGTDQDIQQIAWTNYSDTIPVNTGTVVPYFCGSVFNACNVFIDTTQGVSDIVVRQFRCAFLNPLYDSHNKTCEDGLGNPKFCTSIFDKVTSWTAIAPLTPPDKCPPSCQGGNCEPYEIIGYAKVKIIDVFAAGPATSSVSASNCACSTLGAENFTEPTFTDKALIINDIGCVDCGDPAMDDLIGKRAFLVK